MFQTSWTDLKKITIFWKCYEMKGLISKKVIPKLIWNPLIVDIPFTNKVPPSSFQCSIWIPPSGILIILLQFKWQMYLPAAFNLFIFFAKFTKDIYPIWFWKMSAGNAEFEFVTLNSRDCIEWPKFFTTNAISLIGNLKGHLKNCSFNWFSRENDRG